MKATRLIMAALALVVVSACSSANLTGPDASGEQVEMYRGVLGSGNG